MSSKLTGTALEGSGCAQNIAPLLFKRAGAEHLASRLALTVAGAVGLVFSIAALGVLLLMSIDTAAQNLDRAAASQVQCAAAMAVRDALMADDRPALRVMVERYHRSVEAEDALRSPAEEAERNQEKAEAHELSEAVVGGQRAKVDALVVQISKRELAEARTIASKMSVLRHRTRMLAMLLVCFAVLSTVVGTLGLVQSNRRLSRAVVKRTAQIATVDASRRLFYAKVSHEMKTPITVMRGEAEVALANKNRAASIMREALHRVIVQSDFLNRRVEELLALSQANDGRLTLDFEPLNLGVTVQNAISQVQSYAASNRVKLQLTAECAPIVNGDGRWLEQALVAILDNAVKFSFEDAMVEISLTRHATDAVITIADRGVGVSPDALPMLFDAYYQTDVGRARGGNGLGLALSRWIVEHHGGRAVASGRPGSGCLIELRLPVTT